MSPPAAARPSRRAEVEGWWAEGGQKRGQGAPQQEAAFTSWGSFLYHLQKADSRVSHAVHQSLRRMMAATINSTLSNSGQPP